MQKFALLLNMENIVIKFTHMLCKHFIKLILQEHVFSLTGSGRGLEAGAMSRDPELQKPMKKRRRRDYLSPSEEDSEPEHMVRLNSLTIK